MGDVDRKKVKVIIEGNEKLKRSVKKLRVQNAKESVAESYEDIFNKILSDKNLMSQLRKYVQNELDKPNEKNNDLAMLHRNRAVEHCNTRNFKDALKHINTCLCFASFSPDEMAITYCWRGVLYYGLELYEFCLKDLKRAELLGYPTNTKYVLNYNFGCCYYKLKKFENALEYASKYTEFQNSLGEQEEHVKELFKDLKSNAESRMKKQDENKFEAEQNENKVEAEQESADKMNLNIESRPNATESESLKKDEAVALDEKNRNINTEENENVGIDSTKPHVEGMVRENLEQNPYRTFLEIQDAEDSNNSFNYSAITLNAASSLSFRQDGSNSGREFSDDVEFCYNRRTGFRLKAKNTLKVGTIITTDNPSVASVNPYVDRYYCSYCFQRADIMMLPCNYYSDVRFCSEECRIKNWKKFHYVDCGYSRFLSRTDPTGYLCMRILLKIGVKKVTRLNPRESITTQPDHKPNLKNRDEYYKFLYNIPLKNPSASDKTEAALGAVIMLFFLEKMYTKISKVEKRDLKVEAIKPSDSFGIKTLKQEEKKYLGLRIVKHWLQLDGESIKVRNKRAYITDQEEIDPINYEYAADYVLPLLHLFSHSCDPNVYSVRFEGGPEIFRVARTISPGEFLTVGKGTDIYRHDYGIRVHLVKTNCRCKACNLEMFRVRSKFPKVKVVTDKLKQAEAFFKKNELEKCLKLLLDLCKETRLDSWAFWRLQRLIISTLRKGHLSSKEQYGRSKPESVIEALKAAFQALKTLKLSDVSLCAYASFGFILLKYIRMVRMLSVSAPSALNTPNGKETLSELLELLQHFKEKFLSFSMKTHHEICISSMLRLEERSLKALI